MRTGLWRLAAVIAAAAAGCSGETGVLIEVTRDGSVRPDLDELTFYVGVGTIDDHPGHFVDVDPDADIAIPGRDLAEDPYRFLIHPGGDADRDLMVAVLGWRGDRPVGFGALDAPVQFRDGVVQVWTVKLTRTLPPGFSITDTECLEYVDASGNLVAIGRPGDMDCDGYGGDDCDDLNPDANPGASETCGDGADEDCDGRIDEDVDDDGDTVTTCGGDCDDGDDQVHPGALDVCDGVDNDCNGVCDDDLDGDGDFVTACGSTLLGDGTCLYDRDHGDCDDGNSSTYPGAAEICDGEDNDCNGVCEDGDDLDPDGDAYTDCASVVDACGSLPQYDDCSSDGSVHPGAFELCDGVDDDCDGGGLINGQCFAVDVDTGCHLGLRPCDDGTGSWLGSCGPLADSLTATPGGLCSAYDDCDAAGDPDPFACAVGQVAQSVYDCGATFQVSTSAQCTPASAVLPAVADCDWTVVGGMVQGGFLVGLRDLGNPDQQPAPTTSTCAAVVEVHATAPNPVKPALVVLRRQTSDVSTYFALRITAEPVDTCDQGNGLVCEGLSPPGPGQ